MQIVNLEKIQTVNRQNQLGLVAIDKAHLAYEWDFRQMYTGVDPGPPFRIFYSGAH